MVQDTATVTTERYKELFSFERSGLR